MTRWLDILRHADVLWPLLIEDAPACWQTLDIDYDAPRVERLWRTVEYQEGALTGPTHYRLYLHRIHPCASALWHPHPWPSAIKVLSGRYEMGIGYGVGRADPPAAATVVLTAGSEYEMVDPNGWHYVRPLGPEPSLSLMVSGAPWDLRHLGQKKPEAKLRTLGDENVETMLDDFRAIHWQRNAEQSRRLHQRPNVRRRVL